MANRSKTRISTEAPSHDRAHDVHDRLPLRARHRARGHGGGEPCARERLAPARVSVRETHPPVRGEALTQSGTRCRRRRGRRRSARRRCSSPPPPSPRSPASSPSSTSARASTACVSPRAAPSRSSARSRDATPSGRSRGRSTSRARAARASPPSAATPAWVARSRARPTRHDGVHRRRSSPSKRGRPRPRVRARALRRRRHAGRRSRRRSSASSRTRTRLRVVARPAASPAAARASSRPAHGAAEDIAGQGVANPASMLLAAALMLGEGLGERGAAETLERRACSRRCCERRPHAGPRLVGRRRDDARVRRRRPRAACRSR